MRTDNRHLLYSSLYTLAAIVALFTGFGNMPLYGRYYVADLPGLGWSGNFFTNVNVHILAGSLLLGMGAYSVTTAVMARRTTKRPLSSLRRIRDALMALTLATGILMVIKNLPGVHFPFRMLMIANFTHMGAALLFVLAALMAPLFKKPSSTAG